ncbi:ABC transporter substrate-binding protein [Oceanispirochaeta sp.]|uniref:ABC transporter substrate-binding protein n=1 Tax=Oceanispirochaeta sp. TaxID=2035350 RepID=UPI0026167FFA|nr:ABC transporter substrate-binding protein [Oceanispirochaeta sp.]MDA3957040.1 ABC transporter substrate-binding protein [Oceanispirochaeta sp.]
MKKSILILQALLILITFSLAAEGQKEEGITTIVFGDVSWDSVQVHNRIMGFIIENGLTGYKADYIPGDTMPIVNGVTQGDIDVDMESWHNNVYEIYKKGIDSGNLVDLGKNMPDAPQGWWIPRYLVEGADAQAPNLKSVEDLPKYANLFTDPEDSSKGIIYGGVAGWGQLQVSEKFYEKYGLSDTYNLGVAGSGTALAATMVAAYGKKEPWIGYYWAPTAILGKLDMVRLAGSEYPAAAVNILVNKSMLEKAPDVVEILKKYSTTVDDNNEFLAKMDDEGWDTQQAAEWFLKNKEEVWTKWVSSEVAKKVKAAL